MDIFFPMFDEFLHYFSSNLSNLNLLHNLMPDIGKFCVKNEKNSGIFHHLKDNMKIFTSAGVKKTGKKVAQFCLRRGKIVTFGQIFTLLPFRTLTFISPHEINTETLANPKPSFSSNP